MNDADKARKNARETKIPPAVYCKRCDEYYSPVSGIKEIHEKKRCKPVRDYNKK